MFRKKQSNKKKAGPKVVGTEAAAKNNLERNQKDFSYPETGFVTQVEYTLLYSMLDAPTIYPENVVKDAIRDEEFDQYLIVNPLRADETEERHSYAQLSALLTLAAQKFPPPPTEFGAKIRFRRYYYAPCCRQSFGTQKPTISIAKPKSRSSSNRSPD
jgi:hypothetical protein